MATKLTIRDIARLAGVSKSTVSRVLAKSTNVDPTTAERVHQIMTEYNFAPSLHAAALKGKNPLVGMIVPALGWDLIAQIILGMASVFDPTPYEMLLFTNDPTRGYKDALKRIISTNMTAGIVVVGYAPLPEELRQVHEQGIPVVVVNIVSWEADLPRVGDDNIGGALTATRHLLSLGHRRIAYLQGPPEMPCSLLRYQGYCQALNEAGLEPDPKLVFPGTFHQPDGYRAIEEILQLPPQDRPTALFASSDLAAYGALKAAEERGIRIPEDLALVGYNDIMPSAHTHPALTTIRQPFYEMGNCAADLLLSLLEEERSFPEKWFAHAAHIENFPLALVKGKSDTTMLPHMNIELTTGLVIRDSCGAKRA